MNKVTLQISLAPSDYKHAIHLLPHQIKIFYNQVDEILLTYDTHKSKGRFGLNWEQNNKLLWDYITEFASDKEKIRVIKIDYSKQKQKEIGNKYFRLNQVPAKDWRGGPFYTYFFGLNEAKNDFVFHIDSDIFFGGKSQTWIDEALKTYHSDTKILFISPLPGPPREDSILINQKYLPYKSKEYFFEFKQMSTRLFLVSKHRLLKDGVHIEDLLTLKPRELIRAFYRKNMPYKLPELILSNFMEKKSKIRIDFLGNNEGLWSLHPPYRTEKFYEDLPILIERVETNNLPITQRGNYDIVDDFFDWSIAKSKLNIKQ